MNTNFNLQVSGIPYTHQIRVRFNPVVGVNQTKVLIYEVLVVRPAAYQISTRKCKHNWEK